MVKTSWQIMVIKTCGSETSKLIPTMCSLLKMFRSEFLLFEISKSQRGNWLKSQLLTSVEYPVIHIRVKNRCIITD